MNSLLYRPEDYSNTLRLHILDADRTEFPTPPLEEVINMKGIIHAPWGEGGARKKIVWQVSLIFEGIILIKGVSSGLFSIIVQPKDALILRALTERVGRSKSPRDYLKVVVVELAKHPMYPGLTHLNSQYAQ